MWVLDLVGKLLIVQACLRTGWLACHALPPNAISLCSSHCDFPTPAPPPSIPKCPLRAGTHSLTVSSQSAFSSLAIIQLWLQRQAPLWRDLPWLRGLERWNFETGVQCPWQLRGAGRTVDTHTETRVATDSGLPAWCSLSCSCLCGRTHGPIYLVSFTSTLFLESTAYEELGVYVENKSWWLLSVPVAKSTQQHKKDQSVHK